LSRGGVIKRGSIIVISGPSGVGKTTICDRILERRRDIRYSVSATSRPRRKGERNGREYYFLTEKKFKAWIQKKMFVEWAAVHGHLYGTPKEYLTAQVQKGWNILLDVDVQGGKNLKRLYPNGLFIFIRPPSFRELKKRLLNRKTENHAELEKRLATAWREIKCRKTYGYTVVNDDLDRAANRILSIIDKETGLQPEIIPSGRKLTFGRNRRLRR
jgi:guanylate kinase